MQEALVAYYKFRSRFERPIAKQRIALPRNLVAICGRLIGLLCMIHMRR